MIPLGAKIQWARKRQSLSVDTVAKMALMSVGSVRAYEQGRRTPSAKAFKKLLTVLDINGHWINDDTWVSTNGERYRFALDQGSHVRREVESPKEPNRILISTYLRPVDADKFDELSQKMDLTRSQVVRVALLTWLNDGEAEDIPWCIDCNHPEHARVCPKDHCICGIGVTIEAKGNA